MIKIHRLPNRGDVLVKQNFGNLLEIRANMGEMVDSGVLIADIEIPHYSYNQDLLRREFDQAYNRLCELPGVIDSYRSEG